MKKVFLSLAIVAALTVVSCKQADAAATEAVDTTAVEAVDTTAAPVADTTAVDTTAAAPAEAPAK
jgi:PBP1b-binding outer membrane lipoprotein LpoB